MSTTTMNTKGATAVADGFRLTSFASALIENVKRAHAERVARAALQSMDDRMLADIGLTRSDIARAVRDGLSNR